MSLDQFFKQLDARSRIPRPANALHLDAYQAGFRLMRDVGLGSSFIIAGLVSAFIWWQVANILLRVGYESHDYAVIAMLISVLIGTGEAASLTIPYYRITQRLTHGSARWADIGALKDFKLVHNNRMPLSPGALRIGRLTRKYDLALPFDQVLRHMAIFGPPGSGKSSTFFMSMARDWSQCGSAIFLDPKGELYKYTARHFERAYRLDLADPRYSDRWNFVPACKGDAEVAHEIASIIVGYDANKNVAIDPFWPQAEMALLTALLLHLPQIVEHPTPAMITEFIADPNPDSISARMMNSPDPAARLQWGIFQKADPKKTQGSVFVGLGAKLLPLNSPHALAVMQPLTDEEREQGLREIDLNDLRRPGTAVYVVIPEGDATRYKIVLSILFGLAASVTRKTSDDENGAPVLLCLDEAGNIPLHNLSEALGVGRGRKCGIVLGYQNIAQLYKQYGRDGAQAILGSVGTQIFLPGLDSATTEYAAKRIGHTTVLQQTVVDATGNLFDQERQAETGRYLLDAAELRQMADYCQAVTITGSAPPVKFGFPAFAKDGEPTLPPLHELAHPLTLAESEKAFAGEEATEDESGEESDPSNGKVTSGGSKAPGPVSESHASGKDLLPQPFDQAIYPQLESLHTNQVTKNGGGKANVEASSPPRAAPPAVPVEKPTPAAPPASLPDDSPNRAGVVSNRINEEELR